MSTLIHLLDFFLTHKLTYYILIPLINILQRFVKFQNYNYNNITVVE